MSTRQQQKELSAQIIPLQEKLEHYEGLRKDRKNKHDYEGIIINLQSNLEDLREEYFNLLPTP